MSPTASHKSVMFVVDGDLEKRFLELTCRGSIIAVANLNGKSVSIEAFAKRAASLIRVRNGEHLNRIVIVMDIEGRGQTRQEIEAQLRARLSAQGVNGDKLVIGLPDRMIENWILADQRAVERHLGVRLRYTYQEGTSGKAFLKELFRDQRRSYSETADGSALLRAAHFHRIASASPSAKAFFDAIDFQCGWLSKPI